MNTGVNKPQPHFGTAVIFVIAMCVVTIPVWVLFWASWHSSEVYLITKLFIAIAILALTAIAFVGAAVLAKPTTTKW